MTVGVIEFERLDAPRRCRQPLRPVDRDRRKASQPRVSRGDIDDDESQVLKPERGGVAGRGIGTTGLFELIDRHLLKADAQNLSQAAAPQAEQTQLLCGDRLNASHYGEAENVAIKTNQTRQVRGNEVKAADAVKPLAYKRHVTTPRVAPAPRSDQRCAAPPPGL